MQHKMFRILIVDDQPIVREGLRALLAGETGLTVVGEADNSREALRCASALEPDIVLLDLSMPKNHGLKVIRDVKRRLPETKVVILTIQKAEEYVHAALQAGADAYVLKEDSCADLLKALRSVMAQKVYLSAGICRNVVRGYLDRSLTENGLPSWTALTVREKEIVLHVSEGLRNREIADVLCISIKTVEKHRANFMKKLELHSVSAVTSYVIENGLVSH